MYPSSTGRNEMTNKEALIRIAVLATLVCLLLNGNTLFGEYWKGILFAVAGWQLGTWSTALGNYLAGKYCGK